MKSKIILYPKNTVLYQGLQNIDSKDNWFSDNIEYSCIYANKNTSVIKKYKTNDYLNLLNIETFNINDINNIKNFKIKDTYISLQELIKAIFGINCKKTPIIKTLDDINDLNNVNSKFKDTQYYKFYNLAKIVGRDIPTIEWFKKIIKLKNRKVITKTSDINRISDWTLDLIFFKNLKKYFPKIDGYYCPNLKSDWNMQNFEGKNINDYKFYMPTEIALYNIKKLDLCSILNEPQKICYDLSKYKLNLAK